MSQLPNNNINSPCQNINANSDSCLSLENLIGNENNQSQSEDFYQSNEISNNFYEDIKKEDNKNENNQEKNDTLKFDNATQECRPINNGTDKDEQCSSNSSKKIKNFFIFYRFRIIRI